MAQAHEAAPVMGDLDLSPGRKQLGEGLEQHGAVGVAAGVRGVGAAAPAEQEAAIGQQPEIMQQLA